MTDIEMRIAIAGACGWKVVTEPLYGFQTLTIGRDDKGICTGRLEQAEAICDQVHLPDYPNDLNAMHDAEKVLDVGFDGSQADEYHQTLFGVVNAGRVFINEFTRGGLPDVGYMHKIICATARQRAEAFLRTLNKWKD